MMHELFDIISIISTDKKRNYIKTLVDKFKILRIRHRLHLAIKNDILCYPMIVDFIEFYKFSIDYIGEYIVKDMPISLIGSSSTYILLNGYYLKIGLKLGDITERMTVNFNNGENGLQTYMYKDLDVSTIKTLAFKVIGTESFAKFKNDMAKVIDHIIDEFIKRI